EGYGIVIEGAGSRAYDNVLEDNDIGLQYQEGNTGDQNTAGSPWFGRGSAVETCVAPGANTFLGNSEDERVVPTGADLVGGVFNTGSGRWYCTIGAAVADAGAGDTLQVREGTYAENVVIDRALTLHGPHHGTPGADASRGNGEAVIAAGSGQALRINADNVVVSGLTFTGLGGEPASVAVASGGN